MTAAAQLFSAGQLAKAMAIAKPAFLKQMRDVPATGTVIIRGNPADAWSWLDIPAAYRAIIERRMKEFCSPDVHAFICSAPAPWQPPFPLEQIADATIAKAGQLRVALARVLELRNNPNITAGQLEAFGQEDFHRVFKRHVTDRTIRALIKRTVERDNFAENWNRLEIYLDGNPQRKSVAASDAPALTAFAELSNTMATFKSASEPSSREKETLWLCAVKLLHARRDDAAQQKWTRVQLVKYLWRCAPWLSRSKNAMRVALAARYALHLEKDCAENSQRDGREAKLGIPTAEPIGQPLIDNLTACALWRTGGRLSQASRIVAEMAIELDIDHELADLLSPDSENKSYVNRRLREAVRHEIKMIFPYTQSQRVKDNHRASLKRKYNFPSGFCYSADDVTLPVYWIVPDGKGWFNLVRGQCIITIDVRSLRILGFSLQPDRNYSSPVIHTNFTRVFSDFGVPRNLYLERGIWYNSKLITGGAKARTNHQDYEFMPFSWAETERGFGDLGVKFMHAILARSKVVETVIRLVQALMEAEPGYCGREERYDMPATTKQHMDALNRHHPGSDKYFYDFNQWEARLVEIFNEYNAETQQGAMLDGLSPKLAFEQLQSDDENKLPMLFDHTSRHLLAHYRVIKPPGRDGITITIGKKKWVYRSKELGRDRFRPMLGWFNPDEPSCLAVTDMNMKHPYTVPLSNEVDAIDPDPELLATELERVADYESYGKARYQVLKADFAPKFRRFASNRAVMETGHAMRQQREVIEVEKKQADTRKRTIGNRAATIGLSPNIVTTGHDGEAGLARILKAIRNQQKKKAAETL